MKREFLRKTVEGITDEQIDAILDEYGERVKESTQKAATLEEQLKAITTERDGLKEQITQRDADLADLRAKVEGQPDLEAKLAESEARYKKETEDLNKQLEQQELDFRREAFFNGYKFSSKAAETGIKAKFDEMAFKLQDGKFLGGEEFMKNLMEDDDYKAAFVVEEPQQEEPPVEPTPQKQPPKFSTPPQFNPQPPKKHSLSELMQKKNENPNMTVNYD